MVTTQEPATNTTSLTLENLVQDFLLSRENLQPKTRRYYRSCLRNFLWYAQNNGWPSDAGNITRDHIRAFLAYIGRERNRWGYTDISRSSSRQASPATVHHYGRVVKAFFNWAEEEEYLDENPTLRLKLAPPRYKEVEPYSDDEVKAMLSLCDSDVKSQDRYYGIRNKAIISLFVATGLRLTELSGIRLADLDPRLNQARVMGKGAKTRVVPINGEAKKSLKRYLDIRPQGGDELWKTSDGLKLTVRGIEMVIKHIKGRAGIDNGGGAHRFRHYFATRYLEAGGDLNTLRLLLGHATLYMVLRYSRYIDIQKALAGHREFSPLDRLYGGDNHRHGNNGWGWKG